ncbi:MAG TPA: hypothetical protein VFV52_02400 [Bacilli bacterium]|nr:hypothetical protein [Bacilli bacterium]
MLYRAIEQVNARRVALVGIAKHAGKTTAMNDLIESATHAGRRLGVLSIGVDGERQDAIMGVSKPEVYAPVGTLVASAGDVLNEGSAVLTVLERTGISSALGDVYLAEVTVAGTVLLAGIRYGKQVAQVLRRMEALGAELCLVDGAFERMMAADPELTDGVVLATGAVVGKSVEEVARQTAFFVQRFSLPVAEDSVARLADVAEEKGALVVGVEVKAEKKRSDEVGSTADGLSSRRRKTSGDPSTELRESLSEAGRLSGEGVRGAAFSPVYAPIVLAQTSSFAANPQVDPQWPGSERARVLAVGGAVTDRLLAMLEGLPRGFTLALPDATHFFATAGAWRKFLRRGHRVVVRRPVRVLGLTVNPHSVAGYELPRRELLEAVREVAGDVPVTDVKLD